MEDDYKIGNMAAATMAAALSVSASGRALKRFGKAAYRATHPKQQSPKRSKAKAARRARKINRK